MNKPVFIIAFLLCIFFCLTSKSQVTYSIREYKQSPHWIAMMEDSLTNYFEAQKAFDLFWSVREMPKEEDQIVGMKGANEEEKENKKGWLSHLFKRKNTLEESELAAGVKKFKHWSFLMEPWVQEDGHILYPSERISILKSSSR